MLSGRLFQRALNIFSWQKISKFNPFQTRKSTALTTGALMMTGLTTGGIYVSSSWRQLTGIAARVEEFKENTFSELQARKLIFKPLDRLYSIHSIEPAELKEHRAIQDKISGINYRINKYIESLGGFAKLRELKDWRILNKIVGAQWIDQTLSRVETVLGTMRPVLHYVDQLNIAELYFKQHLYDLAEIAIQNALKYAEDQHVVLSDFSREYLRSHAYNLAAKVARSQKRLKDSDNYYEHARNFALQDRSALGIRNHLYICCSQVALWGDMAWGALQGDKTDLSKIKQFLKDEQQQDVLIKNCRENNYRLGLANLSWFYIRAVDNAAALELSEHKKQDLRQKALELANAAVELAEHSSLDGDSVNPWLFRGIAKMNIAKVDRNKQLLESALLDFTTKLELYPDHPSLLNRKAMTLEELGRNQEAQESYRDLIIELEFRLASGDEQPPYTHWLESAKLKLMAAKNEYTEGEETKEERKEAVPTFDDQLNEINHHLIRKDYQQAYHLYDQLLQKKADVSNKKIRSLGDWFKRHFTISPDKHLTFFSPEKREKMLFTLELDQLPSPGLLMRLSSVAYQARQRKSLLAPPSGWDPICSSFDMPWESMAEDGYVAVAFQNTLTKQIVIAHGGTDISEWGDLKADAQLALGQLHDQLKTAKRFTEHVIQQYAVNGNGACCHVLYHTGHSLGGHIAAYMACASGHIYVQNQPWTQYAVTFDNPSCWWQLDSRYQGILKTHLRDEEQVNFPITACLTRPSFINCAGGPHLGRIIKLPIHLNTPQRPQDMIEEKAITSGKQWLFGQFEGFVGAYKIIPVETVKSVLKQLDTWSARLGTNIAYHAKDKIDSAFTLDISYTYQEPQHIYYAQAWPGDLKKWMEFEELMSAHTKDLAADIPDEKDEKLSASYKLKPLIVGGKEVIPLKSLESYLRAFFFKMLSQQELTEEEGQLKTYFSSDFFHWIKLSADQTYLEINGPLSAWQMLGYMRSCVYKYCQNKRLSYDESMYPFLKHFDMPDIKPLLLNADRRLPFFHPAAPTLPTRSNAELKSKMEKPKKV